MAEWAGTGEGWGGVGWGGGVGGALRLRVYVHVFDI